MRSKLSFRHERGSGLLLLDRPRTEGLTLPALFFCCLARLIPLVAGGLLLGQGSRLALGLLGCGPCRHFRGLPFGLSRRARPHGLLARPVRLHAPASRLPVGRRERFVPQAWLLLPPDALRPPDRRGPGWRGISPASPFLPPRRRSADLADWGARSFSFSNLVSSGSERGRPVIGWINRGQRASDLCRCRCHGDGVWQA